MTREQEITYNLTSNLFNKSKSTTSQEKARIRKMFLDNDNRHQATATCCRLAPQSSSQLKQQAVKMFSSSSSKFTKRICHHLYTFGLVLALFNSLALVVRCQLQEMSSLAEHNNNGQQVQLISQQQQNSALHHYQEILAKPNSEVRIECRLPQMTPSNLRSYYWIFQRTSNGAPKPHTLCFEGKCPENLAFGIELDMDQNSNTYDLLIRNVTYESNDGLYYCDYRDTTPESKQTISREIRLTVLISPQPPTILPAQQSSVAREGQEYQLNCLSHGGNPEPNITWFREDQEIQVPPTSGSSIQSNAQMLMPVMMQALRIEQSRVNGTTTSTLSWIPTIDDHQANFKCAVWNKAMESMKPYLREFRLQVEYAPRISVGIHQPLKVLQGTSVTLPCLVDANPPVKGIRWFKDKHLISNQFNHTIHDTKISDASIYSCQADNGIAPPSVAGSQSHASQTGGSSFFSFLGLSQNSGSQSSGHSDKSPTAVEAQLHLQVLYPPRVQVKPTKLGPLQEGESGFALNCSVDSWPPPHEFMWTRSDDPSWKRHSTSSSYLDFQPLSASDMANYTCTAFNRLEPSTQPLTLDKQGSGMAQVQVRHQPGVAELAIGHGGETELGAKTLIHCRAKPPGFPEPQYKFWRFAGANGGQKLHLNSKQTHTATYTIHSAKADDEAKYGCSATNELGGSSEADGDLVVNEVPTIIHDASTRRDEEARFAGDPHYAITIRASGKPEPKVSWFHRSPIDGRRVELSSSDFMSKFKIETVSKPENSNQHRTKFNVISTLTFKQPLEVDDRGLYTVEFNNGLSRSAQEDFQLHIHHAPIPAPRNFPIISSGSSQLSNSINSPANTLGGQQQLTRIKAGFDLGETVNFTCRVSAYPKPEFYWHFTSADQPDKPLDTNSRYRITLSNPRDDIWESTLGFSQAQEADYGDYMCVTANLDQQTNRISDSVQIYVSLMRKTTPEPPYQLEPIDSTQDSITLQWIPGFDGGFALNQFLVQYAPDDGSGQSMVKRFGQQVDSAASSYGYPNGGGNPLESVMNDPQQQQDYPRLYDCYSRNPCTIDHLNARQAYVFRVKAKNERGNSEFSEELHALTRANVSQIPKILHASYDAAGNKLHFRVEPGSDYMLNNLNLRVEVRPNAIMGSAQSINNNLDPQLQSAELTVQQQGNEQQQQQQVGEWRQMPLVQVRQEKMDAYLNIPADIEQLKLTLCTRSNESLCGPEYVISMKSATSSYLQAERGLSLTILMSTLTLIIVLGAFATTLHSCCLSRKNKKVVDPVDKRGSSGEEDKPQTANGATNTSNYHHLSQHHHHSHLKPGAGHTHGSTTSTNSTSVAANGTGSNGSNNGLQSMDSQMTGGVGIQAQHHHGLMSDHSNQVKLESMLPPNYNHYADRATLLLEQQQQQYQQQQQQQQQHLMSADKLGSPFGLPNSALLSVAQQHSPSMMNGVQTNGGGGSLNYFAYGSTNPQMELQQQQQSMSLDPQQQMMEASLMMGNGGANIDPNEGNPPPIWQPADLDYSTYNNTLAGYAHTGNRVQDAPMLVESAYGVTGANNLNNNNTGLVSQQAAAYDNSANNAAGQQYYMNAYRHQQQQQQQYQQEMAVVQQQIYGTLTRNGYNNNTSSNNNNNNNNNIDNDNNTNNSNKSQQLINNNNSVEQQYSTTNGLMQQQPLPPPLPQVASNGIGGQQQPQQNGAESDYGTIGGAGRNGRLIREIIV